MLYFNALRTGRKWLGTGLVFAILLVGIQGSSPLATPAFSKGIKTAAALSSSLNRSIPLSEVAARVLLAQNISGLTPEKTPFIYKILTSCGLAFDSPRAIMANTLQSLDYSEPAAANNQKAGPNSNARGTIVSRNQAVKARSFIAIYCTHMSETYRPDSDNATHIKGGRGLVNDVTSTLADSLRRLGYSVIFDDTIHDSPDFNLAYVNSRQTAMRILEQEPNLVLMLDIHRDSVPSNQGPSVVEINGRKAAGILLIVGSADRRPNPNWQANLHFAQALQKNAEQLYPGLVRAVRVKPGTYNQDLFSPSILIEMGNEYNSYAEASYSAELMAEIIDETLSGKGE